MKVKHPRILKLAAGAATLVIAGSVLLVACGGGSGGGGGGGISPGLGGVPGAGNGAGVVATVPRSWASGTAYREGVVSTQNPYAAEAGVRILEQGGNAVDAAVAVAYALNVAEPVMSGVGGGGFMMVHLAGGDTFTIDSREMAPAGAQRDMFVGVDNPTQQGVAVGVPGMVRGTALAVEKYGKLTLAQNLQPAIDLAEKGFAATPRWTSNACSTRARNSPEAEAYFCPGGQAVPVGALVKNVPLAQTFKLIAANGADCFYRMIPEKGCDIAQGIVQGQRFAKGAGGKGGTMTLADLEAYQPAVRKTVDTRYRGWTFKSMPPPSSGGLTVFQVLGMLERFPLGDKQAGYGFGAPKTLNVMADALRIAYADRRDWMGDNDFVPVPSKGLSNPAYLIQRGTPIVAGTRLAPDPNSGDARPYESSVQARAQLGVKLADPQVEHGTAHVVVADKWGNVVTYTNTVESGFGIGVLAGYQQAGVGFKNFGFVLNNELTDFNWTPTTHPWLGGVGANDVQPRKRPRSSMAPTIVFSPDGKPVLAFGAVGGSTIISSVLGVALNMIDHGMSMQQAIDAPRLYITGVTPEPLMETTFPAASVDGMTALGYKVTAGSVGAAQGLFLDPATGNQYGGADQRFESVVAGLPRAK